MDILLKYFSDFTTQQENQFRALKPLYEEWNEKINVISRKDIDGLYEKHVLHSLSIAVAIEFSAGMKILDLGTGGGFPGIPLAIFFPEVNFLLADSIAKKLKVVDAIASGIGLTNISTKHTRAEEIRDHKFDFVVSRAVAPLKDLWRWSKPLLKKKPKDPNSHPDSPDSPDSYRDRDRDPVPNSSIPGLICLKGGDLALEIQESLTHPRIMEVFEIFPESYYKEKYLLYVTR